MNGKRKAVERYKHGKHNHQISLAPKESLKAEACRNFTVQLKSRAAPCSTTDRLYRPCLHGTQLQCVHARTCCARTAYWRSVRKLYCAKAFASKSDLPALMHALFMLNLRLCIKSLLGRRREN